MKKLFISINLFGSIFLYSQNLTGSENYLYARTYSVPVTTEQTGVPQIQTVQYFDGLGRVKQNVAVQASPTGKDIVVPVIYDENGKLSKSFLPIPISTQNGAFQSGISETAVNTYYGIQNAYSQIDYEKSPIPKITKSASPGNDWQISGSKTKSATYLFNTSSEVKRLRATTNWNPSTKVYDVSLSLTPNDNFTTDGFYNAKTLHKIITKDEDGTNETHTFLNSNGKQILLRKVGNSSNGTPEFYDTYYVYDDNGNLAFVIPPKAATFSTISQLLPNLNLLCYQYKYDKYNRLVEKRLPGKAQWESIVYDRQGRPVLSQDAKQFGSTWSYVKYDKFDRVVYNGIYNNTASRATLQANLDAASFASTSESKSNYPFAANDLNIYYTNTAFPTSNINVLAVHYYDEYPTGSPTKPANILGISTLNDTPTSITANGYSSSRSTKTLPTASMVKNIEDNKWTKSYVWYDQKSRVIGTHAINHLDGYTKTEIELDFLGNIKKRNLYHSRNGAEEVQISESFTYDHLNRLLTHKHKVDANPEVTLAANTYNELSQLISKNIDSGLQNIEYTYNIQGWLTGINPSAINNIGSSNKLFSYVVKYNNPEGNASPKYNGTISEVDWVFNTGDKIQKRYSYQYDGTNRLLEARFANPTSSVPLNNLNNEKVTYDLGGNITSLERNTTPLLGGLIPELVDKLNYTYSGNKLLSVADISGNPTGYEGGGSTIDYDSNGNMINMQDKNIQNMQYNHLNLPNIVSIDNNYKKQLYTYRSDGVKLRKIFNYNDGNGAGFTTITDYIDGFHYISTQGSPKNDLDPREYAYEQEAFMEQLQLSPDKVSLTFFPTAEGFYDYENNRYIYQYKDHLGNPRISYFRNNSNIAQVEDVNDYYPFGMSFLRDEKSVLQTASWHNYKYNNKELQETGFYDYGWRQYLSDIGRWNGIDQLAEKYTSFSPYAYVANNPIGNVDPDGRDIVKNNSGWTFTGNDMHLLVKYLQGGNSVKALESSLSASDDLINNYNGTGINSFWSSFSYNGSSGGSGWGGVSISSSGTYATYWTNGSPASGYTNDNGINYENIQGVVAHKVKLGYYSNSIPLTISNTDFFASNYNFGNNNYSNGSNWYDPLNKGNNIFGAGASGIGVIPGSFRHTKAGYIGLKYYASGWNGGSKANIKTYSFGKVGKGLGFGSFGFGVMLDGIAYSNGTISGEKFGLNTAIGIYGLTGVGTVPALVYGAVDNFYPGGWEGYANDYESIQSQNAAIIPGFITAPYGSQKF